MKFLWVVYWVLIFILVSGSAGFVWMFHPHIRISQKLSHSPLPSFLTLTANAQVTTLNIWSPHQKAVLGSTAIVPDITAKSGLVYDTESNQILFEKNPDQQLPMASLTKIMTAVVALEHPKKDNKYLVTNEALVGEDSMMLEAGEILTIKELLYGLILHSANDAAMTLAVNYPGGVKNFTDAMNQKAQALGLSNTHFTNPSGLEGDGTQFTTATDLLVMTKYALDNFADFRDVAATFDYTIAQTETHKVYYLENETNLLTSYPGVRGVKTGYTPEAGLCLVTYLEYNNHKLIAIVLGSANRRGDMITLLDYSLKKLGIKPPVHG